MLWAKLSDISSVMYIMSGGAQATFSDGVAISWGTPTVLVRTQHIYAQWGEL